MTNAKKSSIFQAKMFLFGESFVSKIDSQIRLFSKMQWNLRFMITIPDDSDNEKILTTLIQSIKDVRVVIYVCTERIFDSRLFMYNKVFLKKLS